MILRLPATRCSHFVRGSTPFADCLRGTILGSLLIAAAARGELTETSRRLVFEKERERIDLIARLAPTVVCVYDDNRRGGGSGVIIDPAGYGLTNFHVVAGMMKKRQGLGGLNDGKLYDLDILGIDPTGDVAMFRISGLDRFPHVGLGDSSRLSVGDSVIAMGNPFVLSEDYTPTVTLGIVTGLHRYQWGTGANLVYSDCIQIDAPINPGSSGGPLFDSHGRVVGINGRISINTRGRFNVGFGYAITINQIKRFLPALRSGLLARHGTLQAIVEDMDERGVVFTELLRSSAAYTAGLRVGDRLLELDTVPIASRNHFASLIGAYPAGWPVRVRVERGGLPQEFTTRLEPLQPKLSEPFEPDADINRAHVEYVLSRYRSAVIGENTALPRKRSWRMRREIRSADPSSSPSSESYEGTLFEEGPAVLRQIHDGGRKGRIIEFTERTTLARSSAESEEEPIEMPFEVRLVMGARFVALQTMLTSPISEIPDRVRHVGSDGIGPGAPTLLPGNSDIDARAASERILEILEWPLVDNVDARFGFDFESGLLARIVLLDRPTATETLIDLDWAKHEGFHVPSIIVVRGFGREYTDSLSGWEMVP
jgi:S1-C subfamily serine protease